MHDDGDTAVAAHRPGVLLVWLLAAALLTAGFVALGIWQLQRAAWKHDLIARVEQRLAAAAEPAPPPPAWPRLNRAADEYRRVHVSGRYEHSLAALVQATTELGGGYWVLTPLFADQGFWLLVNRGFVPAGLRRPDADRLAAEVDRPAGERSVVGLLRLSEPGGSLLQANRPADARWYSRDVAAIAAAAGLGTAGRPGAVAPYFIDAVDVAGSPRWPRPGLTVLRFSDNHLAYALTWFALAAMAAAAGVYLLHAERGRRQTADGRLEACRR